MNGISLVAEPLIPFDTSPIEFTLPTPPKVHKPSKLEILWRKICEFVAKIWKKICFWKSDFQLSRRDVKELRKERRRWESRDKDVRPLERRKLVRRDSSRVDIHRPRHPAFHPAEQPLSAMCKFFEAFSDILVNECLYKETIQGVAPQWKQTILDKIAQLHPLVDELLNLREAVRPFFNEIGKLTPPLIVLQQLVQVLIDQSNSDDDGRKKIENILIERVNALKEEGEITEEFYKQIQPYIHSILNGLFTSQNWLINSQHPLQLLNFISDTLTFFNTFADLLKKSEFRDTLDEITTQINNSFEEDIQKIFQMNTKTIACYLSGRLAELIKGLPFSEAFDEILETSVKHIEEWVVANETKKDEEEKIAKSKYDSQLKSKKSHDVEARHEADQLLKRIKDCGGEETFLERVFREKFGKPKTEVCHDVIRRRISSNNPTERSKLIDEYLENLVEKLIPYFLPEQNITLPDGTKIGINGIANLLNQIRLPRNFEAIKRRLKNIFNKVLDQGSYKDKENFVNYISSLAEAIAVKYIHNLVKGAIKKGLIILTKRLSSKEYLDKLAADNILPTLFDKIFQSWVRATIQENVSEVNKFFLSIIEAKHTIFQTKQSLITILNTLLKAKFIVFQFTEKEIDEIACNLYGKPFLLDDRALFKREISNTLSDVIKCGAAEFPLSQEEIDRVSVLFYEIVLAASKASLSRIDLLDKIYEKMKEQGGDFKWEEEHVDKTRFAELSSPVFAEIYQHLQDIFVKDAPEKKLSMDEIKKELDNYFKPADVPNQPLYKRLLTSLLYKAANVNIDSLFQNTRWIRNIVVRSDRGSDYLTSRISESCSIAMEKVTCSYDLLVTSSVEAAKRTLSDADKVFEVFFEPEPSPEERGKIRQETKQRLKQNILKISILTRETLKLLLPGIFTLSSDKIAELISDLFDNLFCRSEINKSLLFNAFDVIDRNLSRAVQQIQACPS